MENEKRMVGDYTVLCAVNIGAREIILAENEQDNSGERFLCCYGERNDIFEKFTECAVGDDYIDAALFFAERIKKDAEQFRAEMEKLDMLNQASTDRLELAKLLNISDTQLSYITNVDAGHGLIKVGSSLVPFANKFPKNTKLYKLMTTKPGEGAQPSSYSLKPAMK